MTAKELQELFATTEGQAKLNALFHARGKDVLRQMCVEMSQIIVNQQKEIDDLKEAADESTDTTDTDTPTDGV